MIVYYIVIQMEYLTNIIPEIEKVEEGGGSMFGTITWMHN